MIMNDYINGNKDPGKGKNRNDNNFSYQYKDFIIRRKKLFDVISSREFIDKMTDGVLFQAIGVDMPNSRNVLIILN
jgi:hypothetical protein